MAEPETRNTGHPLAKGGLIALAAALGAWNWHVAREELDISPVFPAQPQHLTNGGMAPEALSAPVIEVAAFEETLARPLFEATRRMRPVTLTARETPASDPAADAPVAAVANSTAPDIQTVKLLGVVLDGDTPARALLRWEGAVEADWVEAGRAINGWQLVSIASDSVVIEVEGKQHEIRLFDYR